MGAAGYLVKPFPVEDLFDLIRSVLGLPAPPTRLPTIDGLDVWGDAEQGYFVRTDAGAQAGVWHVRAQAGAWDFASNRFRVAPLWIVRSPKGDERDMTAVPQEGVRALEMWMAEMMGTEAAAAIIAYCAPSQDRFGQIVPRRHLIV